MPRTVSVGLRREAPSAAWSAATRGRSQARGCRRGAAAARRRRGRSSRLRPRRRGRRRRAAAAVCGRAGAAHCAAARHAPASRWPPGRRGPVASLGRVGAAPDAGRAPHRARGAAPRRTCQIRPFRRLLESACPRSLSVLDLHTPQLRAGRKCEARRCGARTRLPSRLRSCTAGLVAWPAPFFSLCL